MLIFSLFLLVVSFQNCGNIGLAPMEATANSLILEVKVCSESNFRISSIHFMNRNAYWKDGLLQMDFDADGIPDRTEDLVDAGKKRSFDSNGDGYRDLINSLSSETLPICNEDEDLDNDGLADCEESVIGTDFESPDSDGDGLIDVWEAQYGLNPSFNLDAGQDPDEDGIPTMTEILQGSAPYTTSDSKPRVKISLLPTDDDNCDLVRVEPVPLNFEKSQNQIHFSVLEVSSSGVQRFRRLNLFVSTKSENGSVIRHELDMGGT
jgi:hypothetical protein